ncbi:MAG: hypothetical protein M1371_03915 [Actinobacteria bacterium]|nr:hypothetical protein [Actinomycetota bacterium]
MQNLTCKERLERTIKGLNIDRAPILDIFHNIDLIEYLSGEKISLKNAEDLVCTAASKMLDLVRHFCVPDDLEIRYETDVDGFTYRSEWWTKTVASRPFQSTEDARILMENDIERIHDCISKKKVCWQALQHVELLGEHDEYLEEVNYRFKRISSKLNGTMMIAPESIGPEYLAITRYDFKWYSYLLADYPDLVMRYLDALCEYELCRIDVFAPARLTNIAFVGTPVAFNDRLIFPKKHLLQNQFPKIKKIIDTWHKYEYYIILFVEGYKWDILDELLELNPDILDPCEPLASMDVKALRKKYPELVIGQPIDCQYLLAYGTPEEIRKATIKAIEDSGKYKMIMGSTSEIHPNIPVENALAMYETVKTYYYSY